MPLQSCPQCGYVFAHAGGPAELAHCPRCGAEVGAALTATTTPRGNGPTASADARPGSAGGAPSILDAEARSASSMGVEIGDDSQTRPVTPEHLANTRAAVDEPISAQWRDETQHLPGPPQPPAPPETTQALPASAAPAPPEMSRRPGRAARGPLRMAALAGLSLALIVAVALAARVIASDAQPGVSPTATSAPGVAPTPTVSIALGPGQTLFTVPSMYAVGYPTGWLIEQRNTPPDAYYSLITAATGGPSVNISVVPAQNAPDPAAYDQQTLTALAAPGSAPTHVSPATTVTIGGQAWTQISADVTLRTPNGHPAQYAHVVVASVKHGDRLYSISLLVATPDQAQATTLYDTANTADFQPLLASFTFLR